MGRRLGTAAIVACALLAGAGLARAAGSQHFEPTRIKPTRKGCAITFCMRADASTVHARPTIGDATTGSWHASNYLVGSTSEPYVKAAFPAVAVPPNGTLEHTIELDYAASGITPGRRYDLTTAWNRSSASPGTRAEHVWGMTRQGVTPITFVAPPKLE